MNTYGWLLLGQTLLALLALGLCGGWVLWPFRRAERPYLWLASPLAGLFALGGSLAVLYFGTRLPFRWCLWVAFGLNVIATVACLVRGRPRFPSLWNRTVATVVVLAAAYWATVSCNKSSIDAREPTITSLDGSDMYGYAMVADWLRAHPASEPPRADHPFEALQYVNLHSDGSRPVSFLLLAAASEVRGTSGLFSYDWAGSVILASAIIGLGGLFGANTLMVVLLAAGGASTNWLVTARTGFMGKSLAFPGSVLLVSVLLTTLANPAWRRVAVAAGLGFAVGFSLNPIFPPVLLGVVVGCHIAALTIAFVAECRHERRIRLWGALVRPALGAVLLFAAASLPAFLVHRQLYEFSVPPAPPTRWAFVIPVALDLEITAYPAITPPTQLRLLYACGALLAIALAVAVRYRHTTAITLVGCAFLVPLAWLAGEYRLYTFHGVLYPLTLAGVAVLAEPLAVGRWGRVRVGLLAVLMVGAVALRVPQLRVSADRYVYSAQPYRTVVRQSDVRAMRAVVGTERVDMAIGHYSDNHTVIAELGARGVPVQFRPPAWERSLRDWARLAHCPEPDFTLPKARFALVERNAYAPPGTERWVGARLKLIEDREAVTVLGVGGAQEMMWDASGRPGVWIGNAPAAFLIHNGTGRPQSVRLCGDTFAGPARADPGRTLVYRLGEQTGKLSLPGVNTAAIPLRLTPGLNRVELAVEEPAQPPPKPGHPVVLLAFGNWRLEPVDAGVASAAPRG